jgi:hypothetical protein
MSKRLSSDSPRTHTILSWLQGRGRELEMAFKTSLGTAQTNMANGTALRLGSEEVAFIATSTTAHLLQSSQVK